MSRRSRQRSCISRSIPPSWVRWEQPPAPGAARLSASGPSSPPRSRAMDDCWLKEEQMQTRLLLLELNEVNFEFVEAYTRRGELPNFAALFQQHGFTRTTSETSYEQLEPWIQWVTAHTGKSLAEHSVFRLGDIASC